MRPRDAEENENIYKWYILGLAGDDDGQSLARSLTTDANTVELCSATRNGTILTSTAPIPTQPCNS